LSEAWYIPAVIKKQKKQKKSATGVWGGLGGMVDDLRSHGHIRTIEVS
jgi:hypothetical protein